MKQHFAAVDLDVGQSPYRFVAFQACNWFRTRSDAVTLAGVRCCSNSGLAGFQMLWLSASGCAVPPDMRSGHCS